jgi:enoyl-CoA hydratase/carnithine racemase
VLDRAVELARALAEKSAPALALAKRLINAAPAALEDEAREFGELFGTAEVKAGLEAFLQR